MRALGERYITVWNVVTDKQWYQWAAFVPIDMVQIINVHEELERRIDRGIPL